MSSGVAGCGGGGGGGGGGGRGAARAERKTRTPHSDVGKNRDYHNVGQSALIRIHQRFCTSLI